MTKIYVFGNPILNEDTLAIKTAKRLEKAFPKIRFIYQDPNEELRERELIALDVAKGINKVEIIEDLNKLELNKNISLHDFDLAFSLKLMQKVGLIKKVKIIAIPIDYNEEKALKEVKNYLHLTFKK